MADANYAGFNNRVNKINRRHRKMSRNYMRLEERDGILIPVPARRAQRRIPFTGIMFILASFFTFKGFVLGYLGPTTYTDRIDILASGDLGEQFGAWVMAVDPVTTWIAAQVAVLF